MTLSGFRFVSKWIVFESNKAKTRRVMFMKWPTQSQGLNPIEIHDFNQAAHAFRASSKVNLPVARFRRQLVFFKSEIFT